MVLTYGPAGGQLKFLGLIGNQIFLAMGLRSRARVERRYKYLVYHCLFCRDLTAPCPWMVMINCAAIRSVQNKKILISVIKAQ